MSMSKYHTITAADFAIVIKSFT